MNEAPISKAKNLRPQDFKNGHQTILKTFIRDKTLIELELTDGSKKVGRVTQFDNYTITITPVGDTSTAHRTYFKSCINSFGAADV